MSHHEQRLTADLDALRADVRAVGEQVLSAHRNAKRAVLRGDRALAYQTILGDMPINRAVRAVDAACHAFVARHLPSAGHLRLVSSVLQLGVGLERIGDYAVTICREAVQLQAPMPEEQARDLDLMADQALAVLVQALEAWNEQNAELARGTLGMAGQMAAASERVFDDLLRLEHSTTSLHDRFAMLVVFNRLDRVVAQAKNICEETLFAVAGETKAPKTFRILFVDEQDDGATHLATAFARQAFPQSGRYASAGWRPAAQIRPSTLATMSGHGLETADFRPSPLQDLEHDLDRYHVIVSLGGDLRPHVPRIPFHSVVLEWPAVEDDDERLLDDLSERIRSLMVTLRGPGTV